jgi:DNA-binding CsgD family transcriptional regulator
MANRKFLYGDTAKIVRDNVIHGGHIGKIEGTLVRMIRESNPRVYYQIACACGADITLKASDMELVGTPGEIPEVSLAEMRSRHFLKSVGMPKGRLEEALAKVSERERDILEMRYGFTGAKRQYRRDIAETLGVSTERVRQLESRAMEKLRASRSK